MSITCTMRGLTNVSKWAECDLDSAESTLLSCYDWYARTLFNMLNGPNVWTLEGVYLQACGILMSRSITTVSAIKSSMRS